MRRLWQRHWPALFVLVALALEVVLAMPFVEHATERNELIHDTQHGLITIGGIMMGTAFHEVRSYRRKRSPGTALRPLLLAGLAMACELALISPPVDHLSDAHKGFHYAAHGAMFICGFIIGAAVREAARRGAGQQRGQQRA